MNVEDLDDVVEALVLEPREYLDAAIIGITNRCGTSLVIYDRNRIVAAFMLMNSWSWETAEEWVSFNTDQAWMGEGTPIIMEPFSDDDEEEEAEEPVSTNDKAV